MGSEEVEKVDSIKKWSRMTTLWACIKKMIILFAVLSVCINVWTMKRISEQFAEDLEEIDEIERGIKTRRLSAIETSNIRSRGGEKTVSQVLQILKLMEQTEKSIRPPSGHGEKIIILGKAFILKRDLEIWDFTFSQAKFNPVATKKEDVQAHKHDDFLGMKCLDLFDGKSHCIEPTDLPRLERYQKISRLYGLRKTLWNKDRFCDTLSSALAGYNEEYMEFVFPCWLLPSMYDDLMQKARTVYKGKSFIAKPTDRGEGNGINVLDNIRELANWKALYPENDEIVVQTYLPNPLLINQRKWDMRTYVLVTSVHPLRVYMYRDGLVRFASSIYDANAKGGGKKTAFLTNTSVNKKAGIDVEDLTWPFPKVYAYMKKVGIDADLLWERIERAVVQLLLSAEPQFVRGFKKLQNDYTCVNCYQLLGVDVIVDSDLVPRVIEVNGEPSMQLSGEKDSHYDFTKKSMAHDLVALIYSRDSFASALANDLTELELSGYAIGYEDLGSCGDGAAVEICLRKHDIEYLLDMKKEEQNMGGFRRIYPNKIGDYYTKYLNHLESKMPYGTDRSTPRIHKLITELSKQSKWKSDNSVEDDAFFKGREEQRDEEED
mmetsp:Transcript_18009/g.22997  ORF Transcript_18009/g.22997 Transcript_18009/m.22997 type:complete len:604 (+) Transcript_18009:310-2121(+)